MPGRRHGTHMSLVQLLACILCTSCQPIQQPARVWLDEVFFSAYETFFTRVEVAKTNSSVQISGSPRAQNETKGFEAPERWDLYHTIRHLCYRALPEVRWPKRVNCVPGTESFTLKKTLIHTMQAAYGEGLFDFMPRSYVLPEQEQVWRAWAHATNADLNATWVLKSNVHRGKGVFLHPLGVALEKEQQSVRAFSKIMAQIGLKKSGLPWVLKLLTRLSSLVPTAPKPLVMMDHDPYVVAQQYVGSQWSWGGRQSYVRVWAVVTSVDPLRLYVYQGGVVIFGEVKEPVGKDKAHVDQVVNLWQQDRSQSVTWTLTQLRQHIMNEARLKQQGRRLTSTDPPVSESNERQLVQADLKSQEQQQQEEREAEGAPGPHPLSQDAQTGSQPWTDQPWTLDIPQAQDVLWRDGAGDDAAGALELDMAGDMDTHRSVEGSGVDGGAGDDVAVTSGIDEHGVRSTHRRLTAHLADARGAGDEQHGSKDEAAAEAGSPAATGGVGRVGTGANWHTGAAGAGVAEEAARRRLQGHTRRPRDRLDSVFQTLWAEVRDHIGLAVAAGVPHLRQAGRNLSEVLLRSSGWSAQLDGSKGLGPAIEDMPGPQAPSTHRYAARPSGYELLGVDFLLDSDFRPHLLEINALPSMAGRNDCGSREQCAQAAAAFAADELARIKERAAQALSQQPQPAGVWRGQATESEGDLDQGDADSEEHHREDPRRQRRRRKWRRHRHRLVDATEQAEDPAGRGRHHGARRRVLQDPASAAATASSSRAGAQQAGAQSMDGFAEQKQGAIHDLLALLGLPVNPAEPTTDRLAWSRPARHRRHRPQAWPTGSTPGKPSQPGFGAGNVQGSGAVLSLVAALLAEALTTAPRQEVQGGKAGAHSWDWGDTAGVVQLWGHWYPRALTAARMLQPEVSRFLCSGAGQPGPHQEWHKAPGWEEGCLWLEELQLVGELEMELSSRGRYQDLHPLMAASDFNQDSIQQGFDSDPEHSSSWQQWMRRLWRGGMSGLLGGHVASRLSQWAVRPSVRLRESPADQLTWLTTRVRIQLEQEGQLGGSCTHSEQAAVQCALNLVQRVCKERRRLFEVHSGLVPLPASP